MFMTSPIPLFPSRRLIVELHSAARDEGADSGGRQQQAPVSGKTFKRAEVFLVAPGDVNCDL